MDAADLDEYATPTLMRAARGVYAQAIRAQLAAIGIDDLPRNGAFVLVGLDGSGGPQPHLPAIGTDARPRTGASVLVGRDGPGGPQPHLPTELGVSKQAVSQVIDI